MELHRIEVESSWRPDHSGVRRRQYVARCLCGRWSEGWFSTRAEAVGRYDEHRAAAAANASMIRAAAAVADHPGPAL